MDIKEKALLMTPCEMLEFKRSKCVENSYRRCGTYAEIICSQWDDTCRLIRERTGKKK